MGVIRTLCVRFTVYTYDRAAWLGFYGRVPAAEARRTHEYPNVKRAINQLILIVYMVLGTSTVRRACDVYSQQQQLHPMHARCEKVIEHLHAEAPKCLHICQPTNK